MKKLLSIIIFISLVLLVFNSCTIDNSKEETKEYLIPEENIKYLYLELGNVIQDGKRAIFFHFSSDYLVSRMEIAGTLTDLSGNTIHSFENSLTFSTPSYTPEMSIRTDADIVKSTNGVSFATIKAYTQQNIGTDNAGELKHIATLDSSTVDNLYASGSSLKVTNGRINIQLEDNQNGCGFRWYLSASSLKSNTKYKVIFYDVAASELYNKSIQLKTNWIDSTYIWPRYYRANGKCFDIISSGEISNEYYQFLNSQTYDEYAIEFSFNHNVDKATSKTIYFDFKGVKEQLTIGKISLYEVINN